MVQDQNPEETQEQETQEEEIQEEESQEEEQEEESDEQDDSQDDSEESDDTDWKSEAQKWKRIATKGRKKKETPRKVTNSNSASDERIERLELRQDGYSDKVIDQIMELGGKEALKNDVVKTAVGNLVEQEKSETAGDVDGASQSSVKTNVSMDELKGMSSKEMEKHLNKTE